MVQYQYTAHAPGDNKVLRNTCYADNEGAVRSELRQMGYTVDSIKPQKTNQIFGKRKRIKLRDLVNMFRRFSVM